MSAKPVTLTGGRIRLKPLRIDHTSALACIGLLPELWRLQPAPIMTSDAMCRWVQTALDDQKSGSGFPFAIDDLASDQVIDSTRYLDIAPAHFRLEVGAAWLFQLSIKAKTKDNAADRANALPHQTSH